MGALIPPTVAGQACATAGAEAAAVAVCCYVALSRRRAVGGVAGREHPSRCSRGALRLFLSHLFISMTAASIVGGMRFLSIHQLTFAACRYRLRITLFRAYFVQLTAPTPHTKRRSSAISQYMSELLAVVTVLLLHHVAIRTDRVDNAAPHRCFIVVCYTAFT
jgi:hypothetical protein